MPGCLKSGRKGSEVSLKMYSSASDDTTYDTMLFDAVSCFNSTGKPCSSSGGSILNAWRRDAMYMKMDASAKWRPGQILTKCIQYHSNNEYEV